MTAADKTAEALAALEELANMPLGISLADWSRLSSPILEALREQAPTNLADAQAQEIVKLREALEPFADLADLLDCETSGFDDTDEVDVMLFDHVLLKHPIGKFKQARAALGETP